MQAGGFHTPRVTKHYRSNVAAILQNRSGQILIGQRSDFPESWQFPQGGVDAGEQEEEAIKREILEEIALPFSCYEIVRRRGPYRYDFPGGRDSRGFYGQQQIYFLCRLRVGDVPVMDLQKSCGEFVALRWVSVEEFPIQLVPPMKQEVYRKVLHDFFLE